MFLGLILAALWSRNKSQVKSVQLGKSLDLNFPSSPWKILLFLGGGKGNFSAMVINSVALEKP